MEVLQMLLEMEDAHVDAFSDPHKALKAARDSSYDVIISDIGMPLMNGHELMHAIRQIAHLKHTGHCLDGLCHQQRRRKNQAIGFQLPREQASVPR